MIKLNIKGEKKEAKEKHALEKNAKSINWETEIKMIILKIKNRICRDRSVVKRTCYNCKHPNSVPSNHREVHNYL